MWSSFHIEVWKKDPGSPAWTFWQRVFRCSLTWQTFECYSVVYVEAEVISETTYNKCACENVNNYIYQGSRTSSHSDVLLLEAMCFKHWFPLIPIDPLTNLDATRSNFSVNTFGWSFHIPKNGMEVNHRACTVTKKGHSILPITTFPILSFPIWIFPFATLNAFTFPNR